MKEESAGCKASSMTTRILQVINPHVLTLHGVAKWWGGGDKEMKWRRLSWNSKGRSCDTCQKAASLGDVLLPRRRSRFGFLSAITEWIIMATCKFCVDGSLLLISLSLMQSLL